MLGFCCNLLEPSHSIPGFYFAFLATTQLEKERKKKRERKRRIAGPRDEDRQ